MLNARCIAAVIVMFREGFTQNDTWISVSVDERTQLSLSFDSSTSNILDGNDIEGPPVQQITVTEAGYLLLPFSQGSSDHPIPDERWLWCPQEGEVNFPCESGFQPVVMNVICDGIRFFVMF